MLQSVLSRSLVPEFELAQNWRYHSLPFGARRVRVGQQSRLLVR